MAVQTTKEATAANHTNDISDLAGWASSAQFARQIAAMLVVSSLVTKKKLAIDDTSGKCICQKNLSPTLEAKYFQWRKARYDGLAVGQKRDKGWRNAPVSRFTETVAALVKR